MPCDLKEVPNVITHDVVVLVILTSISLPTTLEGIVPILSVEVAFAPTFNVKDVAIGEGVKVIVAPAVNADGVLADNTVPEVGSVNDVAPVVVNVVANAPDVVKLPPNVKVLELQVGSPPDTVKKEPVEPIPSLASNPVDER